RPYALAAVSALQHNTATIKVSRILARAVASPDTTQGNGTEVVPIWGAQVEFRMLGGDQPRPERKKAPTIKGRGKLAERLEVEFRPFPLCIALSRMLLGCFAPVLGSSAPKDLLLWAGPNQRSGVPGANSFLQSFLGRLPRRT